MTIAAIFIIISVIAMIVKAVQQNKLAANTFMSNRRAELYSPEDLNSSEEESHSFKMNTLLSAAANRESMEGIMRTEDLKTDFGVQNGQTSYATPQKFEPAQMNFSSRGLNLTPTRKKLAETFILSECFSEPRAKKPFQPRIYSKR